MSKRERRTQRKEKFRTFPLADAHTTEEASNEGIPSAEDVAMVKEFTDENEK